MAKFGSSSSARSNCGMASTSPFVERSSSPTLKALSASSEDVVARSIGASKAWIEPIDSPSFARRRVEAWPRAVSTFSLLSASTCSRPIESPLRTFTASSVIT